MSNAEPSKASNSKKAEYIPGDDGFTRWRNTFNLVLGRLSDEGVAQYLEKRDDRMQQHDCARCEKFRDSLLQYSESGPARDYANFSDVIGFPSRSHYSFYAQEHQPTRRGFA